ncbi:MAG: hypothetical protein K2L07_09585 [Lachnospiraceae bacterium]|nr:hypothetical protein [Lachnospiraceae bacterium]
MIISTVKQFNITTMNKRRLSRPGFGERLSDLTDVDELKEEIADTLEKKGRVYGIYEKKELVGVYIFERREDYFSKTESGVKLWDKEFGFDKFWYGESTAALHFKKYACLEEVEVYKEKIEKGLKGDLTDQIQLGQVAGVEWNDKLMYRTNLGKKSPQDWTKTLALFAIGFATGWMVYDSLLMAILFGCIWGSVGVSIVEKAQMDTLDFINKREVEANATK